jgi:hypothetical protein
MAVALAVTLPLEAKPCSASKLRKGALFSTRVMATIVFFNALHEIGHSRGFDVMALFQLGVQEVKRWIGRF